MSPCLIDVQVDVDENAANGTVVTTMGDHIDGDVLTYAIISGNRRVIFRSMQTQVCFLSQRTSTSRQPKPMR